MASSMPHLVRLSNTVITSSPKATRGSMTARCSQSGTLRIDKRPNVVNEKSTQNRVLFFVWCEGLLLLQETCFEDNAAAVNLAVYLLVVLG